MNSGKCLIWPDCSATVRDWNQSVIFDSPRAGGYYHEQPDRCPVSMTARKRVSRRLLVDWRNQQVAVGATVTTGVDRTLA